MARRKSTGYSSKFNEEINFIIGSPPVNPRDDDVNAPGNFRPGPPRQDVITNAMPLVHIQPGTPNLTQGLDLMSRNPAFTFGNETTTIEDVNRTNKSVSYLQQLEKLGFTLKQGKPGIPNFLTCAYLADSFPTDTFTNEYGENFLQKITNVASEGMAGVSQMFGGRRFTDVASKGLDLVADATGTGGLKDKLMGQLKAFAPDIDKSSTVGRILDNVNVLAAGGRIDFPMLWKNSTYAPSYTMTIRLYNPNPNSLKTTAKYIIGPVAALLLLGLPQSVGAGAYSWPYIHKFWSPGIYDLDPGYISNITVIKGGDQQQISWKQRMGVVDVRIDFGSVFNSILSNASASRNRPTLSGYLNAMAGEKEGVYGLTDFNRANNEENQSPVTIERTKNIGSNSGGLTNKEILHYSANRAGQRADLSPTQEKTQLDITEPGEIIQARVTEDLKEIADNLIDMIPLGIKISF